MVEILSVEAANAALLETERDDAGIAGGDASRECAVCLVRRKDAVLAPCGHLCACFRCASRLERNADKCPICRATIASVVKVWGVAGAS